jgi:hypothetical protein
MMSGEQRVEVSAGDLDLICKVGEQFKLLHEKTDKARDDLIGAQRYTIELQQLTIESLKRLVDQLNARLRRHEGSVVRIK